MGLVAAIGGAIGAIGSEALGAVGIDVAATSVGALAAGGALTGGAVGGVEAAIEGKNILTGIAGGAAGGLVTGGLGAELGGALGGTAAGALSGALGGVVNAEITGGNPLTGALLGGGVGGVVGSLGGGGAGTAPSGAGAGDSAAGVGASPAAAAGIGGDFTVAPIVDSSAATGGVSEFGGAPTTGAGGLATAGPIPMATGGVGGVGGAGGGGGGGVGGVGGGAGATPTEAQGGTPIEAGDAAAASSIVKPTATGVTDPATSSPSFMKDPLGYLTEHPALALSGLGLGYMALKGNQPPAGYNQLSATAAQEAATGQSLVQAGTTGNLPVGAQEAVDTALRANEAQIRQQYANMGLSGSTMEAQALGNAQSAASAQVYSIMQQLMTQGLSMEQAAAGALQTVMQSSTQQNASLNQAIALFAGGLAGKAA
jgi:hypothetical protein